MTYHECPIEPDDWSNGPGESEGEECRQCEGTGTFNREAGCIDGIYYDAIQDATCDACQGSGFVEADYDDEPDRSEFD